MLLLLLRVTISWCSRRIRIRVRGRVRVRVKLIRNDLLGSGIRVWRAVVKGRVLWAEMGVDVGGEAGNSVLLPLDLLQQ